MNLVRNLRIEGAEVRGYPQEQVPLVDFYSISGQPDGFKACPVINEDFMSLAAHREVK